MKEDMLSRLEAQLEQVLKERYEIETKVAQLKASQDANPRYYFHAKTELKKKNIEMDLLRAYIARERKVKDAEAQRQLQVDLANKRHTAMQQVAIVHAENRQKKLIAQELAAIETIDFAKRFKFAAKTILPKELYDQIIAAASGTDGMPETKGAA